MKAIIGVDPGVSGAIALLRGNNELAVWDTPYIIVKRGVKKVKGKSVPRLVKELDEEKYSSLIDELSEVADEAVVEKVGSMKDQGVASSFAFGQVYGGMRMGLAYAGVHTNLVSPSRWKLAMGCGANKDSSLLVCLEAFPGNENLWFGPRQATLDGRCEAALLALYGYKFLGIT